jgi:hypothetical protein
MLTAVVIAAGLVFITRGIGGSLRGLSRIEEYERLLRLAESQLNRLEVEAQQFQNPSSRSGQFDNPDDSHHVYTWDLQIKPLVIPDEVPPGELCDVALTVKRSQRSSSDTASGALQLHTLWPASWVTDGCA